MKQFRRVSISNWNCFENKMIFLWSCWMYWCHFWVMLCCTKWARAFLHSIRLYNKGWCWWKWVVSVFVCKWMWAETRKTITRSRCEKTLKFFFLFINDLKLKWMVECVIVYIHSYQYYNTSPGKKKKKNNVFSVILFVFKMH